MTEVTMQNLFEAGAHFGHQTQRWNPKMAPYIFTQKNKVHIIDLQKTVAKLEEASKFAESVAKVGGKILFVGTKKQAQGILKEEAEKCGMPYVSERWLGGMLTNFQTIAGRTKYLKDLEAKLAEGTGMTKKEKLKAEEELTKLKANLGGIMELTRVPDALFIIDIHKEITAVKEARKMGIPIIGVVDTNVNPEVVDYPIPANDDAVKAIKILCSYMSETILKTPKKKEAEAQAGGVGVPTASVGKIKPDKEFEKDIEKAEEVEEKAIEENVRIEKKEEKEKEGK